IRIEASSGLTDEEIEKMKQEAEANAEADKAAKDQVEKINQADSLIFQTEKQMTEFGEKLSADNKSAIEGALTKLKEAHGKQDLAEIDTAMEALNNAWQAASQEMYAGAEGGAPGADPSAGAPGGEEAKADDVSDVEFEEVEEEKK
ncbi:MAG: Hsp70 family protein, partial [Ekhidna sp.]